MCLCMGWSMFTWMQYLRKPEGGISYPGVGVSGACKPPSGVEAANNSVSARAVTPPNFWTIALAPKFCWFWSFVCLFWDRVSLCSLGWPGTCYVDQPCLYLLKAEIYVICDHACFWSWWFDSSIFLDLYFMYECFACTPACWKRASDPIQMVVSHVGPGNWTRVL